VATDVVEVQRVARMLAETSYLIQERARGEYRKRKESGQFQARPYHGRRCSIVGTIRAPVRVVESVGLSPLKVPIRLSRTCPGRSAKLKEDGVALGSHQGVWRRGYTRTSDTHPSLHATR